MHIQKSTFIHAYTSSLSVCYLLPTKMILLMTWAMPRQHEWVRVIHVPSDKNIPRLGKIDAMRTQHVVSLSVMQCSIALKNFIVLVRRFYSLTCMHPFFSSETTTKQQVCETGSKAIISQRFCFSTRYCVQNVHIYCIIMAHFFHLKNPCAIIMHLSI